MSFNISQFKNRDQSDAWLNLVGKDGKPMFYLQMTKAQREKHAEDIEKFLAGEDVLSEFKKPIRLKMKSVHSEAFRKAKMHRKLKDQILLQGIVSNAQKQLSEDGEMDMDKFLDDSTDKLCDGINTGAKMICELTIDWEGFTEGEESAEYNPDILMAILTDPDYMVTYTNIIKSIDEKEGFFTA